MLAALKCVLKEPTTFSSLCWWLLFEAGAEAAADTDACCAFDKLALEVDEEDFFRMLVSAVRFTEIK